MSPSRDDVDRQLDRLLKSTVFANAGRMSRFLKFVVEKTLAGEGERLKEFVIGVEVFDRDSDYDPRVDSIVRVEAARLRSKLAEYYAGEGRDDSIVLTLPKGGYAAVIALHDRPAPATNGSAATNGAYVPAPVPAEPVAPTRSRARASAIVAALAGAAVLVGVVWVPSLAPASAPRVAVLPFESDSSDARGADLAARLTEGVTAELVRTNRFAVVASSAARAAYTSAERPRDLAAALDADVLVEARVLSDGDRVRVEARASDGRERKFWVEGFAGTAADSDALEREIATGIAAALSSVDTAAD